MSRIYIRPMTTQNLNQVPTKLGIPWACKWAPHYTEQNPAGVIPNPAVFHTQFGWKSQLCESEYASKLSTSKILGFQGSFPPTISMLAPCVPAGAFPVFTLQHVVHRGCWAEATGPNEIFFSIIRSNIRNSLGFK